MKPTDEDVEVARIAAIGKAWTAPDDAPTQATIISAALEAYTPRLIERLAREAEERSNYYGEQSLLRALDEGRVAARNAADGWLNTTEWLRSHLEKNHD